MCSSDLRLFLFNEATIPTELRAQRHINKSRIPEIARYIVDNPKNYIFSALTASIDGNVNFKPLRLNGKAIGSITIERMNHYKFENSEPLKLEKLSIALGKAFEWSNDFKLIENAAIHDGLTSLLNHNAFLNRLDQEIDRCSRFQTSLGLIMLDLDKFKKINDTYGHLYGDYILKEVGKIIKENVRTIDVVGRFGGEEFSVILVNTNVRDCIPLAKRIVEGINRKTFIFDGIATNLTISAGMSGYPSMSKESKELIKMADDAMYQTKKKGGNDVTIFQS